jgi:glycosyltransferase involved in cell wall biosynthesis
VVHAYTPNAHALCALASIGGGPPLLATRHLDFPVRDTAWTRAKYGACARIVCVSRAVRAALLEGGVDAARTVVIPCAITPPPAVDRVAARRDLGLEPDAVAVLNLAAWVEQKDPLLLLSAWPAVAAAAPTAVLLMAGGGALEGELRTRAAGLDRVRLLGHRDDVPRLLAAADAFVLPSRNEGLPLAVMEAQAAGLPVVATRAGGTPELIDDGVDGQLIAIGDRTSLAERLLRLAIDPDLRARLGAAARVRARSYAPERLVRAHLALYRRVARA